VPGGNKEGGKTSYRQPISGSVFKLGIAGKLTGIANHINKTSKRWKNEGVSERQEDLLFLTYYSVLQKIIFCSAH
jgi:hypothetical protein